MLRARRTSHNVSSRRLQSAPKARLEAAAKEHLAPLPGAGFRAPREGRQSAGESNESCRRSRRSTCWTCSSSGTTRATRYPAWIKVCRSFPSSGDWSRVFPHLAPKDGHDCVEPPGGHLCLACHGFSALVTGRRGSEERSVLFDVGPSAEVWLANARRLGVRLTSIEAVCLSHWHAGHSGGLRGWWLPSLGPASTKGSRRRLSIHTQTGPTSVAP